MKPNMKLGIIGAMESEIGYLVGQLKNKSVAELYGYVFYSGELSGRQVTVVKCGIGKVNAARGTQLLVDRFGPDAIVNTGIAGALDPALRIGDAVIATGLIQHDFDVTAFGHTRGYLCTGAEHDKPTVFVPDKALAQTLAWVAKRILTGSSVTEGIIATGDLFVADAETRRGIRDAFNAVAAEMEGAAIAQVASYAEVPFTVLRVVSDNADGNAAGAFEKFEAETAKRSAAIIKEFLEHI